MGTYGCGKVVENEYTVSCNAKAGMDDVEFSKYLQTSVMPHYPDAQDPPAREF